MENRSAISDSNSIAGIAIAEFLQAIDDGSPLNIETWLAKYRPHETLLREFLASENELLSIVGKRKLNATTIDAANDSSTSQESAGHDFESTPITVVGLDNVKNDISIPDGLANYRIGDLLGQGGMGTVYQATDKRLNRQVAVKLMRSGVFADQRERKRFRREAEAVAQLEHPNIVPIYEVGEDAGQNFFVMKLLKPLNNNSESQNTIFQDTQAAKK